jgi:adenylate cyclase
VSTSPTAPGRDTPFPLALAALLVLPVLGLVLLLSSPSLDVSWEHHPAHFWLVLSAGALNAALAAGTGAAARRRGDARVLLASLAFLSAAGFLGLHALATPKVLLDTPNAGFAIATPVGLLISACFVAWSSIDLEGRRGLTIIRHSRLLVGVLLGVMALWAVLSLSEVPPFDDPTAPEHGSGLFVALAVPAIVLYAVAVVRYLQLWRRRGSRMLLWMAVSFVLLAEAMLAVAFAPNWHASWWEWHLLMLTAFGLVAISAQREWHEERYADLYLDDTLAGKRELTVLFADLQGFTSFSERHDPREVTAMLNEYFQRVIPPVVRRYGGEVDNIIGDALMVTFNTRGDQPDHALRAARAALALQERTRSVTDAHPSWPRFRVGVNTGEAAVSLLGTSGGRTHTAIGDAVNLASRLEGKAPVGGVAIGPATRDLLPGAVTEPLGTVTVKGREEPVEVHLLLALNGPGTA